MASNILNEEGVVGYSDLPRTDEGTFAGKKRAYINPVVAQISTLTVALAESGLFTATFTTPSGTTLTASYTATVAPDTNETIAQELADDINGQTAWANVAKAEAVGADVTITFSHTARVYTAVTSAPGAATLTHAVSKQAGGVPLPLGRWVVTRDEAADDTPAMALPTNAAVADDFIGLLVREHIATNTLALGQDAPEVTPVPTTWNVGFDGYMEVTNHGSVTAGTPTTRTVHVVIDTAGGQEFGESRADADGGNTVALPLSKGQWITRTKPGERGRIQVRA